MRISFYSLTHTLLRNSSTLAHLVILCNRRILAQLRLCRRIATLQSLGASVPASRRFTSPRLSITRTDRTITMSLRRSTRVSSKAIPDEIPNGKHEPLPASMAVKRGRKRKSTEEQVESAIQAIANTTKTAKDVKSMLPPPATPKSKRRKVAQDADIKPPPFTPTPSAIGLMTSNNEQGQNYSTGDIDDPAPPATRPVHKHHTNATLITPGGTQLQPAYSNFEEASPSKPGAPKPTSKTLLDEACAHLIKIDSTLTKKLKPVIEQHHCHVFSPEGLAEKIDPFRSLSSGIMAQQVSGAAASSIKNKFIALFPPESCPNGFPPPALVAATDIATLRTAGLSQRKAEYIQGLAQKFDSGEITTQQLMTGSDEEVMKTLVAVRGLGAWSVEMFMCFGLKRLDVFSTGDLGVQRGMAAYIGKDVGKLKAKGGGKWKYMSEKDMLELAENFRPYRSLFMWYMWRIENVSTAAIEDNAEA